MAALLVAMAVMAVLMSVALPVWRHEAQREKEEELVFRGQQYMRAIRLYQMKTQAAPGSVDLLVTGRFIRKKYKDPITGDDFELVGQGGIPGQVGQQAPAGGGRGPASTTSGQAAGGGRSAAPTPISSPGGFGAASGGGSGGTVVGGIMGVRSKSKDESIRLYGGRNHYNEWNFIFVNTAPGGGGPGRGQPGGGPAGRGQPGQPGVGPGQTGAPGRGGSRGTPPPFGGRGVLPGGGFTVPPGTGRGRSNQ